MKRQRSPHKTRRSKIFVSAVVGLIHLSSAPKAIAITDEKALMQDVLPCISDIAKKSTTLIDTNEFGGEKSAIEQETAETCSQIWPEYAKLQKEKSENITNQPNNEIEAIRELIRKNFDIANQAIEVQISGDELNAEIARRNPSINISIDYTVQSQNYWQCAENEYLEVGVTCATVDGLALPTKSNGIVNPSGQSFAAPFNYAELGSLNSNALEVRYDLINIEQDWVINSKRENLNKTRFKTNQNSIDVIKELTKSIDRNALLLQNIMLFKATRYIYETSLQYYNNLVNVGRATILDQQKIMAKIRKAEANISANEAKLIDNTATINNLLSEIEDGIIPSLYVQNPYKDIPWEEPELLIENAMKENPELLALEYEIRGLRAQARAEGSSYLPKLNVFAGVSPQLTHVLYQRPRLESLASTFAGGVGVDWKLFDSGVSRMQKAIFIKKAEQKQNSYEQLTIKLKNNIKALSREINEGELEIKEKYQAVSDEYSNIINSELRLRAGFEDVTSLLQTIDYMVQSQIGLATAIYEQKERYFKLAEMSHYFSDVPIDEWLAQVNGE